MEPAIRSRKRKQRQSDSDPFGGTFTRSRSQIYFHRHRSGYARPDSNRSRNIIKSLKATAISPVKQKKSVAVSGQITSQGPVKDLRARRVFSPAKADVEADVDVHKQDAGNPSLSVGDLGFSDLEGRSEKGVGFPPIRENNGLEADVPVANAAVSVQMTSSIAESEKDDGNPSLSVGELGVSEPEARSEKRVGFSPIRENNGSEADVPAATAAAVSVQMKSPIAESEQINTPVANEIADTRGLMNKSQSSVPSLRGRKKVFINKTSFNYRRLLPYLMDSENDDSSGFEIVEAALPKSLKSSNSVPNLAASKDEEPDGLNAGLVSTVESSDVVQNSQEDVVKDTLECEQMTPPDSNVYSKAKIDNGPGSLVKPTPQLGLKSCSRLNLLQTPTSFSHRRLLPFLMSVAEDYSSPLNDDESSKPEKAIEQNQLPPTQSLVSTTADETSNSPTSTLIPVDSSVDKINSVALVSNDIILDSNAKDTETNEASEAALQLEEAAKSDSCIKMEQSPPKLKLTCVEEEHIKATPLCIVQSYSEEIPKKVKESPQQYLMQTPETQVEHIKSGILKRTPRGCRGICNCLNCTSFRLHAERSFEFSKNQMHDAEEVALELINDLTHLRNILEASSTSGSFDTVKQKQVKEACASALYKEQEARARLALMNEDLSIHCRSMNLMRPKVTFANKIEEKVISKDKICGKESG